MQPATIFGEQVASAIGHGWLDDVAEDLESVRFTNNRESLYRMQDPETFDRVSEILWQVKRGRSASLQGLPEGIREEVAQFIGRIQGGTTSEAPRDGQNLSPELHMQEQGSLFDFRLPQEVQKEKYAFRLDKLCGGNSEENRYGDLRGEWISSEHGAIQREGIQQSIDRPYQSETRIRVPQHSYCGVRGKCSDGRLGRIHVQTNNEKMDGEINAEKEPCATGTLGSKSETVLTNGWLEDVYEGLENEGYAFGSAIIPACGVGAPHKRDRLFFVANNDSERCNRESISIREKQKEDIEINGRGESNVADAENIGWGQGDTNARGCGKGICEEQRTLLGDYCKSDVADSECFGQSGQRTLGEPVNSTACEIGEADQPIHAGSGMWNGEWIDCPDGKQRLVEPGIPLLAHGVSNRVGKLRGYGNAIVPQVAATFIKAYLELNKSVTSQPKKRKWRDLL